MNIRIAATGKPKSNFIVEGIEQYRKWLSAFGRVDLEYFPLGGTTAREREKVKEREGRRYLKAADSQDKILLLDARGEQYSSQEFARMLEKWQNIGVSNLSFFVGGPLGFSNEVLSKGWQKLALSRMTFTHEMALLILLEQLFRAYAILGNRPYHY
ncbi:MAG: 23S rRNA (pseudouridine(1915)-N(3))-methyltransferase RlmH [Kosmotogaceae bacterium]|nr:23S rRNA (pseudouridine(1915)-N(3))-methyltransferase RlmH [Kosmotogaceae bacterium]